MWPTQILDGFVQGRHWKDHAVLYRMNAQSNQMEQAFKRNGIPYRIIGGIRFFDRAEVKDMLAYLCVVNNPEDDLRLTADHQQAPPGHRGQATVETAQEIARREGLSLCAGGRPAPGRTPSCSKAARQAGGLCRA